MIYERNQVCYLIGFAEYTRFFWWTYNKITDNLYIYYDYQVILLTFQILWQETSTVVIGEVLGEGTGQPNDMAIWSSIQAYTMRSQTNIISFKSSRTVSGRPRLKAVPLPPPPAENQRTATSRSRARLLITVVVTIRTESGAIVITGLHTVDMVSAISTQRYIVYVGLFVWDVYILVGVSILSSFLLPMMMQKNYWMLAESEELRNIF